MYDGEDVGFEVMVSGGSMDEPESLGGDAAHGVMGLFEEPADGVETLARGLYAWQSHEHVSVLHKGIAEPFLAPVPEKDPTFGCEPS